MTGRTELVYLPEELFRLVEGVRSKLGMNRSAFYRHCIMTYLESKSLVSSDLKQAQKKKTRGIKPAKNRKGGVED
jgi:metal-responsive CopG/Arc/MetJ family transcriptional regulator